MSWISEGREEGEKVIGSSRRDGGVADLRAKRALIVYIQFLDQYFSCIHSLFHVCRVELRSSMTILP